MQTRLLSASRAFLRNNSIALVALFVALGGTSFAVSDLGTRASSKTLYACVTKTFHTLNLTTKRAVCPDGEQKLAFNAEGPRGKRGPRGHAGVPGATGASGLAGTAGPQGATGPAGAAGAKGDAGPKGDQGDPGPKGDQGDQGPQGPQGPRARRGHPVRPGPASRTSSTATARYWVE